MRNTSFILMICGLLTIPGFVFSADTSINEPPEPDIVLPEVVLELEDLSVESVDALVPEVEIGIPDFGTVLPVLGDFKIAMPEPSIDIEGKDTYSVQSGGSSVSAEVLLGAGIVNYLLGRISVFNPVGDLRYGFVFDHQTVDGFSFHPAGNGFSKRIDSLDGNLKYGSDAMKIELAGNFTEKEAGLQGMSSFFSDGIRFLSGSGLFEVSPADFFTFSLRAETGFTTFALTGNNSAGYTGISELLLAGRIAGDFLFKPVGTGLSVYYAYKNVFGRPDAELHRLLVAAHLGADFDSGLSMLATGGFFLSSLATWFFPFELSLSAVLSERASVSLKGGFRVIENNMKNTLDAYAYTEPSLLVPDVYGWFGRGNAQFDVFNAILFSLDIGIGSDSSYSEAGAVNPANGLFTLGEIENVLSLDFGGGIKWNVADWLTFSAKNKTTLFLNAPISTKNDLTFEAAIVTQNEAFTGTCSVSMPVDLATPDFLPFLNVDMALKIAEHVKLSLEGKDLLSPMVDNRRIVREPYISEGIQVFMKILVNF